MSRWESKNSNWTIEIPNAPTLIFKLLIFILSLLLIKLAIVSNSLTIGLIGLLFAQFEVKFSDKIKK